MKIAFTLLSCLLAASLSFSQNINWQWAHDAGGITGDYAGDVTTDASGNVYATGRFLSDSITFGSHVIHKNPSSYQAMYLVKFDPNGNVLWTQTATGEAAGYSVATDRWGNAIVGGSFSFYCTFGPGYSLSTGGGGNSDAFVAKYDPAGNLIWAQKGGGPQTDYCLDLATDTAGNIYCTGTIGYQGFATFGSVIVSNTNGVPDIYVAKYDSAGTCLWVDNNGGTCTAYSVAIACDSVGNSYVVGRYFGSSISFNGTLTNSGGNDIFFVKYDTNGTVVWRRKIGASQDQFPADVATTNSGEIYVTGNYPNSSLNIGGHTIFNSGSNDVFLAKYDDQGNTIWARTFGGSGVDNGGQLAVDFLGNILLGVTFSGASVTYAGQTFTNAGSLDLVFMQLDSAGNELDAKHTAGTDQEYFAAVCYGADGSMHATGTIRSTNVNFDVAILGAVGNDDVFVGKLDGGCSSTGAYSATACSSLMSLSGNQVWTSSGTYLDTIPNANGCDSVMLVTVTVNGAATSSISPIVCESYTVPSGDETYTSSGIYTDTVPAASGCDSIITVNLTVNLNASNALTMSACGQYTVPSGDETHLTSGTYLDTIPSSLGCDSVITINLTINQPTTATIVENACHSYTVPSGDETYTASGTYMDTIPSATGCDSVITIQLSIDNTSNAIAASSCNSYTVPSGDETYYASGTYVDTIPNAAGCDSIITINLTIDQTTSSITASTCDTYTVPSGDETYSTSGTYMDTIPNAAGCDSVITIQLDVTTVNASITANGASLQASPAGATYQWVDCLSDFNPISGANSSLYTPTQGGVYAVIVTLNGCSDTSDCMTAFVESVWEVEDELMVQLYPNPAQRTVNLEFEAWKSEVQVELMDVSGRVLHSDATLTGRLIQLEFDQAPGYYFVRVRVGLKETVLPLVME